MTEGEPADVIIVGAGAVGLALALELARRGVDVALLERAAPAGRATSALGAAAGIVGAQAHARVPPEPVRELALLSRRLYADWVEAIELQSGVTCEYDVRGGLLVARTDDEEMQLDRTLDWQRARALPVEVLSTEEARGREPSLGPIVEAAFGFPLDGQVSAPRLAQALSLAVRAAGVRLLADAPVSSLLVEGGRVAGVKTGRGRLPAGAVVNAAGAWAPLVNGVPPAPVEPVRGQLVSLDASGDPDRLRRFVMAADVYVVPRRDGTVIVGSTEETAGYDARPTAAGVSGLLSRAAELITALSGYPVLDCWAGLRPATPDGVPILGETALGGYFLATGGFRNGVLLAPGSALLMADLLTGQAPTLPAAPYSPARFDL